jgi:hydrogenase maturation protease
MNPPLPPPATLIIGLGNRLRGDDALGCLIAEAIDQLRLPAVTVIAYEHPPLDLLDTWQAYDRVLLIDAVVSGRPPGTLHHLDLNAQPFPEDFSPYSSHGVGIRETVEMARVLGKLPKTLWFYGIEGEHFSIDTPLSPAVRRSMPVLTDRIVQRTKTYPPPTSGLPGPGEMARPASRPGDPITTKGFPRMRKAFSSHFTLLTLPQPRSLH